MNAKHTMDPDYGEDAWQKGLFAMASGLIGLAVSHVAEIESFLRVLALLISITGGLLAIFSGLRRKKP